MKKAAIILSAFALASCNQTAKSQSAETTTEKRDIGILLPRGFEDTKPSDFQDMLSENWYDFYQDSDTKAYYLKKATIIIEDGYNDCLATATVVVHSERNNTLLITGLISKNEKIMSIPVLKRHIWVDEKYSFEFNGNTYQFRGDGITVEANSAWTDNGIIERWDKVENYKLYLSEKGNNTEQLIFSIPEFNDTFVQILWIGDLDEDGKPDFILDVSPEYEIKEIKLFLSSEADDGNIVKDAATDGYDFSC